jgi:Domain of unknown function (DUF4270)
MKKCCFLLLGVLAMFSFHSCTDSILAGSDLLDDDRVDVISVDTFKITSTTQEGDSLLTYSVTGVSPITLQSFALGNFNDPIFGISRASLFSQFIPAENVQPLKDYTLDSLVLVLPYEKGQFYGATDERFTVEVREMADSFNFSKPYYSSNAFPTKSITVGTRSFVPNQDSISVSTVTSGEAKQIKVPPQLRIRLTDEFARRLIGIDTGAYRSNTRFIREFFGLNVRVSSTNRAMLSLNLSSPQTYGRAGLYLYLRYITSSATTFREYRYYPRFAATTNIERNRNNSLLGQYLSGTTPPAQQDFILVQGQEGSTGVLKFPNIKNLKNVVVNKAELTLRVANAPGDIANLFNPSTQLALFFKNSDGRLLLINDFAIANENQNLKGLFGGNYVSGSNNVPGTYTFNVSAHLGEIMQGKHAPELYIKAFPFGENTSRSVLYRADHPQYKAVLRLAYTQLKN